MAGTMDENAVLDFRRSLEEMGEHAVKDVLAHNRWNPQRARLAEAWLAELDDTRSARSNRESLAIARSAKNAAWAAAIAAIIAIPIAIASIVIAVLAWRAP